jgi:hypothetical protein
MEIENNNFFVVLIFVVKKEHEKWYVTLFKYLVVEGDTIDQYKVNICHLDPCLFIQPMFSNIFCVFGEGFVNITLCQSVAISHCMQVKKWDFCICIYQKAFREKC